MQGFQEKNWGHIGEGCRKLKINMIQSNYIMQKGDEIMALVPGICTQCGATLSADNEKECMICPYCSTPFIVQKAINNFYNTYNISNSVVYINDGNNDFQREKEKAMTFERLNEHYKASRLWNEIADQYPENYEAWLGKMGYSSCIHEDYKKIVSLYGRLDYKLREQLVQRIKHWLKYGLRWNDSLESWKVLLEVMPDEINTGILKAKKLLSTLDKDEILAYSYYIGRNVYDENYTQDFVRWVKYEGRRSPNIHIGASSDELCLPCVLEDYFFYKKIEYVGVVSLKDLEVEIGNIRREEKKLEERKKCGMCLKCGNKLSLLWGNCPKCDKKY